MRTDKFKIPFPIDPEKTVAFTGFRPAKFRRIAPDKDMDTLREGVIGRCEMAVEWLAERGYNTFITGMAEGFDLWAAGAVLSVKKFYPDLRLIAFIPHPEQTERFSTESLMLYREILTFTDERFCVSDRHTSCCYFDRNRLMLAHSSLLVCYYDDLGIDSGGTKFTVENAQKDGRTIINLCGKLTALVYNHNADKELINAIRMIEG